MSELTRRSFLHAGAAAAAGLSVSDIGANSPPPELAKAIEKVEPYFTAPDDFQDVSRGKPLPHSIPLEKKKEVGLTRETWKLEIMSDPEKPATIGKQFLKKEGSALDF